MESYSAGRDGIEICHFPGGVLLTLPKPLVTRVAGFVILIFAGIFLSFFCGLILKPLKGSTPGSTTPYFVLIGVILFLLPEIIIALCLIFGKTAIEIVNGQLSRLYTLGPFRYRKHLPQKRIVKFTINPIESSQAQDTEPMGTLIAVFEDSSSKPLLSGYKIATLEKLASELRQFLPQFDMETPNVEVNHYTQAGWQDLPERPPNCAATIVEDSYQTVINVPRAPISRSPAAQILRFAIIWLLITTLLIFCFTLLPESNNKKPHSNEMLDVFFLIFLVIGFAILGQAVKALLTTASITVRPSSLEISIQSPFHTKRISLLNSEIKAIRVVPTGNCNNTNIMELQIHTHTGKKLGILSGRDADELRWIATCIRAKLNKPAFSYEASEGEEKHI